MAQEASAADRKVTGLHNGVDRGVPNPKECKRGTGDSLNACEMKLNWREKLGVNLGLQT
jgi:hypothetical protein